MKPEERPPLRKDDSQVTRMTIREIEREVKMLEGVATRLKVLLAVLRGK